MHVLGCADLHEEREPWLRVPLKHEKGSGESLFATAVLTDTHL
jgi:hypothetical protein